MVRRLISFLACLVILIWVLACTTTPKYNFPQGSRVGIINLLEPYATHQNFSNFATKNFRKTYTVDWDMPAYAQGRLRTLLEKDARLTVVEIKVSELPTREQLRLNMVEQVILSETAPPTVPPQGVRSLDTVSDPYDVQAVVVIGSYSGPSPFKSGEERLKVQGYGLFTRKLFSGKLGSVFSGLFSFRKAYAYAQIGVVVYKVQPVIYICAARTIVKGRHLRPIKDFNWDADLRNLPESELDQAKPLIQGYINEAVSRALGKADLTPPPPPEKESEVDHPPSL
ncbi:MAG: hypothetical protein PVG69_08940 [Desulfobacterales bacterium]|jgi:hypothetical protein